MRIDIQKNQEASDGLFVRCIAFGLHHALQKTIFVQVHTYFFISRIHVILSSYVYWINVGMDKCKLNTP